VYCLYGADTIHIEVKNITLMSNTNDRDANIVILVMLLSIVCYETMSAFV